MKDTILLIIHKLSSGGAERVASDLANILQERYNVILLVFNLEDSSYSCNAKVINLDSKYGKFDILKNISKINKIKKEYNVKFSISFLTFPNLINVLSRKNDKVILTIHNNLKAQKKGKIIELLHKYSCKKADKIVCVSDGILQSQINDFNINKDKLLRIYNICDHQKILSLSDEEIPLKYQSIFNTNNLVINVGRLEEQKMQKSLVLAFKEVVKKIPDSKLVILGNGSKKNELENIIKKLDLKESIFVLDFDSNPYKYMKKAKILVLTSKYEGLPTVILESLALSLPVIATDCDFGPREIINKNSKDALTNISYEEYGVLIPDNKSPNYLECISKSIVDLLINEEKRSDFKKNSSKRIEEFSKHNILSKWDDLFSSLR